MKRTVAMALCVLVFSSIAGAQQVQDWSQPRPLSDYSEENQVLVIGALETTRGIAGITKNGPDAFTFARVQPIIGPRVTPQRLGFMQDSRLFVFDKVKVGEVWKLFSYNYSVSAGRTTYLYSWSAGIMGDTVLIKPTKPGILYIGSFVEGNGPTRSLELSELEVLQGVRGLVERYPGWKAEIDKRIKELKK